MCLRYNIVISLSESISGLRILTTQMFNNHLTKYNNMRKIETQMCEAIRNRKHFKSGNTEVRPVLSGDVEVYLHGNWIALVTFSDYGKPSYVNINNQGWKTPTTKSRFNAILRHFSNWSVYQKAKKWYSADSQIENSQAEFGNNRWEHFFVGF